MAVSVNLAKLFHPASASPSGFGLRLEWHRDDAHRESAFSFSIRARIGRTRAGTPPMPRDNTTWTRELADLFLFSWAACSPTSGGRRSRPFVRRCRSDFFGACTDRRCFRIRVHGTELGARDAGLGPNKTVTVFDPPPPQPTILIETLIDSTFSRSPGRRRSWLVCVFRLGAPLFLCSASWCRARPH